MLAAKLHGIDRVIDYRKEDYTQSEEKFDIIIDTINKVSISACKKLLKPGGIYLVTTFGLPKLANILGYTLIDKGRVYMGTLKERAEDMDFLRELIETGTFKVSIDKTFPLEEAAEAHRYVESGDKAGYVALTVSHDS